MFEMLLGHLVGDYLLQNGWMAMNKSKKTIEGWFAALIHCIIYALAVCVFMWNFTPIWMIVVFLSHFLIDKFGFTEWYLTDIKGRSVRAYIKSIDKPTNKELLDNSTGMKMLQGGFTAVVYTIVDNTWHIVIMWTAYKLIFLV